MKTSFAFAAVAVGLGLAMAASPTHSSENTATSRQTDSVQVSPHRQEIANAQAALAWKLLAPHSEEPQAVVSPASLASAVSVVTLGASPIMKTALMKALDFDKFPPAEAERRLGDARAALMNADPGTFIAADRFVSPPAMTLSPEIVGEFDRRGISHVALDLQTAAGVGAVNAWVKQATRGEIDGILSQPLQTPAAVALNAL